MTKPVFEMVEPAIRTLTALRRARMTSWSEREKLSEFIKSLPTESELSAGFGIPPVLSRDAWTQLLTSDHLVIIRSRDETLGFASVSVEFDDVPHTVINSLVVHPDHADTVGYRLIEAVLDLPDSYPSVVISNVLSGNSNMLELLRDAGFFIADSYECGTYLNHHLVIDRHSRLD